MSDDGELNAENEEDLWAAAAEDLAKQRDMLREASGGGEEAPAPPGAAAGAPAAAPPTAAPAAAAVATAAPGEMDRIMSIPLHITVELGRAKMLINDLMQLGQGSVIELTKLVGEPLEVLVNDQLVGKGEVVVVNEKFGVRITDIATQTERIETLA